MTERIAKYLLPMGDLVSNCKGADKGTEPQALLRFTLCSVLLLEMPIETAVIVW